MKRKLYQVIASTIDARLRCKETGNTEWFQNHTDHLKYIEKNFLPSGSGIDGGTNIRFDESTGDKIVLGCGFHHMDENGMYDGWTDHTITITPSLIHGLNIKISGRNRNDIKEYLHEVFYQDLTREDYTEKFYDPETITASRE